MKHITAIFLLTVFFLCGCKSDNNVSFNEGLKSFPIVLDTSGTESFFLLFQDKNPSWLYVSNYYVNYIGEIKDTLYLIPEINFMSPILPLTSRSKSISASKINRQTNKFYKYYLKPEKRGKFQYCEQAQIGIQVDTSNRFIYSYPVLIVNKEKDTIRIGNERSIPIIMEAIDSLGNWMPIQEKFVHACGFGLSSIILPPSECVITLAPIFKGNYKTQLRITLGENHSNPFIGFINYRQFQSVFNEKGEYKDEYLNELDSLETTNR
jgi:hypothetical protein